MRCISVRAMFAAVVLAAVLSFTSHASAAVRFYQAQGTAQFVSPTDFIGAGLSTVLGQYTEVGSVAFTPTDDPAVLRVTGTTAYTALNGDSLDAQVHGTLNLETGKVRAMLFYVGGTGEFEDARGVSRLNGQMYPDNSIVVTVIGVVRF